MEYFLEKKTFVNEIRKKIELSKGQFTWNDYVNALKLISQVVFTRSSSFILEFIQNAEDSALEMGLSHSGKFEIFINKDRLKIIHNGGPFREDDVKALCGIRSSKKPEKGTLGYLGIGFKSVFKVTDSPELYSNGYQFKFDRNSWDDVNNTPWHVIPLWIEEASEHIDHQKTSFIIPFREESNYEMIRNELEKLRIELYLFLRWLHGIEVYDEISDEHWELVNLGENKEGFTTLRKNGEERKFKFFRREVNVPEWVKKDRLTEEYRANVAKREIAIAFAVDDEGNLDPSEAGAMYGGVYSFLPLGESSSGAKFPIQADFLVQPGRDSINYEAKWNHWLAEEVSELCKNAIVFFKQHEKWKYQFMPPFVFNHQKGLESYEKLFRTKLIEPLECFIEQDNCIPTSDGEWGKIKEVIRIKEEERALNSLVTMSIANENEIASAFGGEPNLKIVHKGVRSDNIKEVDRFDLLKNHSFLEQKSFSPEAGLWFRSLYQWLHQNPVYDKYFYRTWKYSVKQYHDYEIVFTNDNRLLKGGDVYIFDITSSDLMLKEFSQELKGAKSILHPYILDDIEDEDLRSRLRGFLTGFTGVQIMDSKKVCKDVILPKIKVNAPVPSEQLLLKYTAYCQKILGDEMDDDLELWVLTKDGDIRPAREAYFPKEFRPDQDWESFKKYIPGISFLSKKYIDGATDEKELSTWRKFFKKGGIKDAPDSGVEEFGVNYAEEILKINYKSVNRVEKRKVGYDLEVYTKGDKLMRVEVKGLSSENDVELTPHETDTADIFKENYYLCVVYSIPNNPEVYLVRNPAAPGVGKKDKLTIPIKIWKKAKLQ